MNTQELLYGIVALIIGAFLYFIPAIIGRKSKNGAGIFILNIFLGWTFVGWVLALVWAYSSPNKVQDVWINTCDRCGFKQTFDQPLKLFKCPQCGQETNNI